MTENIQSHIMHPIHVKNHNLLRVYYSVIYMEMCIDLQIIYSYKKAKVMDNSMQQKPFSLSTHFALRLLL